MGTILLVLSGIWALRHIPLDALPDISDVEVIIHTPWAGQPPSIIEDQVTYPIVTTLLAAPHVKAVRAQTMFGDSYVFVIFEDTTDLYWARSRVLEYMQQITGRLPAGTHPSSGRTRPAQDGFMNMCLWTIAISAVWPTCGAFKIGICATNSKLFQEWRR